MSCDDNEYVECECGESCKKKNILNHKRKSNLRHHDTMKKKQVKEYEEFVTEQLKQPHFYNFLQQQIPRGRFS